MLKIERAALPLAAMVCVSSIAVAQIDPAEPEVTVVAPQQVPFEEWALRVERNIDEKLHYPRPMMGREYPEGIVDVTFRSSDSGQPYDIVLDKSSGSTMLDRAGLRAIRNMESLYPLAQGVPQDQLYKARLFFATDDGWGRWEKRYAELRDEAVRHNNAWMNGRLGGATASSRIMLVPSNKG